jgi:N-acetylglucosaminyldiphosphoundecaprenol N-acetyl-beta-D-mannosaminyltransferase
VFTPNVDHVLLADEDPRFRAAYEAASLSVVDGMPVLWALRLAGHPVPEKVSGSDLVRPAAGRAADEGWRMFLLGGRPGVAREAAARLRAERPALEIVGAESPMMHEARDELQSAVIVGIGAGLDFLVGTARRAPPWMSSAGLEWLYRHVHEATRLWRRYLVRGPRFLRYLVGAWLARHPR